METYTFYPPQMKPSQMPYEILVPGSADCKHEILADDWADRVSVLEGIIFVRFSCKHCGRQLGQSLDEVLPPSSWKGAKSRNHAGNGHKRGQAP
jgi:hypothetical protein